MNEQQSVGEESKPDDLKWGWRSFKPRCLQWLNSSIGLLFVLVSCSIVYGREYLTIKLQAGDFCEVIVDEGEARILYKQCEQHNTVQCCFYRYIFLQILS